jgi:MurNAc alpha-1-phosphate uridylyltransferase
VVPFVYAGAAILTPASSPVPSGSVFDVAVVRPRGEAERLCGLRLDGVWMHVGTPDAVKAAEEAILASAA